MRAQTVVPGLCLALAGVLLFRCARTAEQTVPAFQAPSGFDQNLDTDKLGTALGKTETFVSSHLGESIIVPPGVFMPYEAEYGVLPFVKENAQHFAGKEVLEIGTGSGIISLYAARLGARKVVATDINDKAIAAARANAEALKLQSVIELRLVPSTDISAYSVIGSEESFDTIISNPPYSLDLDAQANTAVTDRGDLGLSIIRGLETHMKPGGSTILLYNSIFYHQVMVKFARHGGYTVRSHVPESLSTWATEALFNSYLERLLVHQDIDPKAFRFDRKTDEGLFLGRPSNDLQRQTKPLFPGNTTTRYGGMIVIEHRR